MAGTGRGHPPGTAEPPRDGRAPARRTAPTDHAAVPSRRPRAGARERVWGRGGPPHTRGGEAQRRGESGMNPDPLRAGTGDREPAGRETTHRANGLGGRDGRRPPPDERRRRRGPGRREKTGPRACSQTRGGRSERGGRDVNDDDDTRTVFPSRDVRGDAATHDARTGPDLGVGESHRPEPPPPPHRRRKSTRKRGVSHRQAPNPVRWRFPTRDAPPRRTTTTGPEESPDAPGPADPPPRRRRRTSAKPPSLARFPRRARSPPLTPSLARTPPPRQTRPPPPKESPPAATGPDASGDAPGDDRPPFSPKAAPEREVTTPQSQNRIPDPEEGRVNRCSPTVGTPPGRGSEATSTRHATGATHARDARGEAAVRGNGKDGEAREGPLAAGTDGGRVGPGSPPPPSPALPARLRAPTEVRTHPRGSGGNRGPAALGRARTRPLRSPPRVTHVPGSDTHGTPASRTRSLVPRGSSPDSERGGAGRSGRHKRSGFPPRQRRDAARGATRSKLRASGVQGVTGRPQARPLIGSLEKALFLTEGGRDRTRPDEPPAAAAQEQGERHTHRSMISSAARWGGSAVSVRLFSFPFRGAFLSVRGQGGPDREKAYYVRGPPRARPASPATPTGSAPGGEAFLVSIIDRPPLTVRRKLKGPAATAQHHRTLTAYGRRQCAVGRSPDLTRGPSYRSRLDPLFAHTRGHLNPREEHTHLAEEHR